MKMLTFSELVNVIIRRSYIYFLRFRLLFQLHLGFLKPYQPNPFSSKQGKRNPSLRNCADRYEAFSALLPQDMPLSVLDIGCEQGYFVFRMAERGGFCIGIDWDRHKIEIAQALSTVYNVNNALFAQMDINNKTASTLPKVDMVICLSIFHHWAHKLGEYDAKEIMIKVSNCAEKYLIFETGQPNEVKKKWAERLSFIVPDIDSCVRSFLYELGFEKIHNLGQFPTSVSNVPRNLYVAIRNGSSS